MMMNTPATIAKAICTEERLPMSSAVTIEVR
jgi:hypothetical protein